MTKTIDEILSYEHDVEGCQALHSGSKCLHCNEDPCPHCKRWGGRQRTEVRSMVDKKTKQALTSLIKELVAEARIDELQMIETAQQNTDQWGNFCIDDTSDFSNYIGSRISELEQNLLKALEEV